MASSSNPLPILRGLSQDRMISTFVRRPYASLTMLVAAVIVPLAIRDYLTFLSYGPGGMPFNVFGWLMANMMRIMSREQLSTHPYTNSNLFDSDSAGFLPPSFPPRRNSPRPTFGPHPIPQRQVSQLPNEATRRKLIAQFDALGKAAQKQGLVDVKQSLYERHHSAFFVSKALDWHPIAQQTRGEITHIHAGLDGSIHVVLHPKDCKKVIESKWGQRHGLSGVEVTKRLTSFSLPINYVLVYAPRNEAETEVALAIIRASIAFMTGSEELLE